MSDNWRLAWRNIWRNRRRTWLTVGAMVFSNVLLIFLIALQLGSYDLMIENSLRTLTGHLQVQQRDYRDTPRMRNSIEDVAGRAAQLRAELGLAAIAARAEGFALASSEARSFGVQVIGVQPDHEPLVSSLPGLIREGRWFSGPEAGEAVLGSVLARNLKIGLGDEVTFVGTGRDGSFAAGVVAVVGIVHSGFAAADRGLAQVPLGYFDTVFAMRGHGHRIVVEAPALGRAPFHVERSRDLLRGEDTLAVLDWDALQPGLRQTIRADMTSAWIIYGVLIVLVAFSVLNTQLMSVLERTREFGVMLALGIGAGRLGRIVIQETLLMALTGLAIGVVLGFLTVLYFSIAGLTFPGMAEAAAKFNLPAHIYPEVSLLSLFWGPLTVSLGGLLAAVYPALRLRKLRPVAAMREI